jgi:hypothetical protein
MQDHIEDPNNFKPDYGTIIAAGMQADQAFDLMGEFHQR